MSVLVVQPNADSGYDTLLVDGSSADLNLGTSSPVAIGTRGISKSASTHNRLLLRFDVSGIPAGATINSAQLLLRHNAGSFSGSATFLCSRVTQPAWIENQATWNSYSTGNAWITPGGDYTTVNQVSMTLSNPNDLVFTGLKPLIDDAISNRARLLHVIITGPEVGIADEYVQCGTSDDESAQLWPTLTINYTPVIPPAGVTMTGNLQELTANLGG
ncbi:MAG TPA: DNRLRE domain-containing protein [Pirellulales bacterium]|jgi:hypothetical protein|nr:DNRLRE domain-containing protein [Pirellulales bacterium]